MVCDVTIVNESLKSEVMREVVEYAMVQDTMSISPYDDDRWMAHTKVIFFSVRTKGTRTELKNHNRKPTAFFFYLPARLAIIF